MKKTLLTLAFFGATLVASAQNTQTVANHSASISLLTAEYAYEHPLAQKFTIIGRGGLAGGFGWTSSWFDNTDFHYVLAPIVGAEGRYYYNFARREALGRRTDKNAGSFLALRAEYYFPSIAGTKGYSTNDGAFLSPLWGMRRVSPSGFMFELTTGLDVSLTDNYATAHRTSVHLNARIGWVF